MNDLFGPLQSEFDRRLADLYRQLDEIRRLPGFVRKATETRKVLLQIENLWISNSRPAPGTRCLMKIGARVIFTANPELFACDAWRPHPC